MRLSVRNLISPVALCLLLAGCAQTGPPLPPSLELPKPPSDLRATRKGNRVTLTWSDPRLTTDHQSVRYQGPTQICRSSESDIAVCGNPLAVVSVDVAPAAPESAAQSGSRHPATRKPGAPRTAPQTYTDTLDSPLLSENPSSQLTYAVEALNPDSRGAGLSNQIHVPAVVTLPAPNHLAAHLTADGAALTWTSHAKPQPETDRPESDRLHFRYRIYRQNEATAKASIAGEVPSSGPASGHFIDTGIEWEKSYLYRVTAVTIISRSDGEIQVEGDDTAPIRVVAHDVFPPPVPAALQAAFSGEGQRPFIDLIWTPVTSADLAGYNVYRSDGSGAVAIKINPELVKSSAYRDQSVAEGNTYNYAVSAVDVRGNESAHSQPASESVP